MSLKVEDNAKKFARYQHDFWDVLEYLSGPVEYELKFLLKCINHDRWNALFASSLAYMYVDKDLVKMIEEFVHNCDKKALGQLRLTPEQAKVYKLPEVYVDKLFFMVEDVGGTPWLKANLKYEGEYN